MSLDAISRLWMRLRLVVGRGRVQTVQDAGHVQKLQVQLGADETIDGLPRLAEYGFQSSPPAGSDAIVLFLAGERSNGVVIACGNQQFRLRSLADGEVAISDDKGQSVYLSAAGIRINGGSQPMVITNTPHLTISTIELTIDGETTFNGGIKVAGPITQTTADNVSFLGTVSALNFNVPASGLSLLNHRHGGVQGGPNDSGTAIPLT